MQDETGLEIEKETTITMLAAFAEAYRQEVTAEEDVYRTLPFFGTALGIVIAAIGYAAGRLTRWEDTPSHWLFVVSTALLALAAGDAIGVIVRLSQALARRDYQRVGPESVLQGRLAELRAYYDGLHPPLEPRDELLAHDFRQTLVGSYVRVGSVANGRDRCRRIERWRDLLGPDGGAKTERILQGPAFHVRGDPMGAAMVSCLPDQLPRSRLHAG